MSSTPTTSADACTVPQDLARRLDDLLTDRDKLRELYERKHTHMVYALQELPGTKPALDLAYRAWAAAEAADLAAEAALQMALQALRCSGVAVDLPVDDDAQADSEGDEL